MGNYDQLALVLCITFVGVIVINAGIIMWARRKEPSGEIQAFRRLADAAKSPFAQTTGDIEELSRLVAEYKQSPADPSREEESVAK
jgi:hypothetical protein